MQIKKKPKKTYFMGPEKNYIRSDEKGKGKS